MSIIEFGIILIFTKSKIGQWESLETFSFPLIIEIPLFKCQLDINMKKKKDEKKTTLARIPKP